MNRPGPTPRTARVPTSRITAPRRDHQRHRDDRGEGVISTAIAVLVVAFLGTMMWIGFRATFTHAQSKTDTQVEQIGAP